MNEDGGEEESDGSAERAEIVALLKRVVGGKAGQIDDPEVVAARRRVAAACRTSGKFAMAAGLFASLPELLAEGFRVFNVGADVVGLGQYVRQRVELVADQAKALATGAAPGVRSPYS